MKTSTIVILVVLGLVGLFLLLPFFGSLMYFGAVSPTNLLPDRCTTPPGFSCVDYGVSDSEFFVELENSMGESVTVESFVAESSDIAFGGCSVPGELANTESTRISCDVQSSSYDGGVRIEATIAYSTRGSSFPREGLVDVFIRE